MPRAIEIDVEELGKLAELQCTIDEAAAFFDCSSRTIHRYLSTRHRDPKYRQAWERGRALGRISLRRLQWQHAQGTGLAAVNMTIHLSKFILGESEAALRRAAEHGAAAGGNKGDRAFLKQLGPDGEERPYEPGKVVPFPVPEE